MEKKLTFHQKNSSFGVFHPLRVLKLDFYLPKKSTLLNPLKMIKNAFNFILEAPFVLKILKFLYWLFGHVEKTASLEL